VTGPDRQRAIEQYRHRARGYDRLAPLTHRLRRRAVQRLGLRAGQTVIDVACGTGLTFALIEDQIGPDGRLIGIDLSPEMLSQARERVAAKGWGNVTLIESAIEDAAIPEVADAAVFVLTHDVMRSPEALGNVLAHVRPGGRIATAGGKRALTWALPASVYLRYAMRRYTTTMEGFDRPWRILETLLPDLRVEPLLLGGAYVAWGTTARNGA
jgi:ubiquinone/menaquinone biosynthesis C-methylase UbiE